MPVPAAKVAANKDDTVLFVIVIFDAAVAAELVIPVMVPFEFEVDRLLRFCTMFPSSSTVDITEFPIKIPVKPVAVAVEVDNTLMLFGTAAIPTMLLVTCEVAVGLPT